MAVPNAAVGSYGDHTGVIRRVDDVWDSEMICGLFMPDEIAPLDQAPFGREMGFSPT